MPGDCHIAVNFHQPPKDLERFFTTFYYVEINPVGQPTITDALHPEWANLRIFAGSRPENRIGDQTLRGADVLVTGPSSMPLRFTLGATRVWGVGLLPFGWAVFIGEPADRYANTVHDARQSGLFEPFAELADRVLALDGDEAAQLALIIDGFRNQIPRCGKENPRILAIHAQMIDAELPSVAEMAERCQMNPRTLERICSRHFGFSPKLLLRRQRFMRSLAQFMLDPSMGWISAIDSLYVDQSHFVRDCKAFLGVSPSEYAATDHPVMAEFLRERQRAQGSPVQTLDPPHAPGE